MSASLREQFRARAPVSDEEFNRAIGLSDPRVISAVRLLRRVVADMCDVPAESLHADDLPEEVLSMAKWPGWDDAALSLAIEDKLRVPIPSSFTPAPFEARIFGLRAWRGATSMGPWFAETARRLADVVSIPDDR